MTEEASLNPTPADSGTAAGSRNASRVAFFMPSLRGGGAERVIADLARGVAKRGYPVDLVILSKVGAVTDDLGDGVRLVDLKRTRAAFALPALVAYLRRAEPTVMLSTLEHTNVLAVMAARFSRGTRVVVREANTPDQDLASEGLKGKAVRTAMRAAYRAASRVVAVSEGVANALVSALGLPRERITVIASPVITERLLRGAREAPEHPWFSDDGDPVILGVGRLVEQKGFDVLVRAFARVREQLPVRLVIFGEGPLRGELTELVKALGVSEFVQLPGFVGNPFSHMAACDLFVLSSRWEGLPNVLIQAMASGAKVVSTDCPSGPREVLDGGELGELVAVNDVDGLAEAILRSLPRPRNEPPPEWHERYDSDAVIERYMQALDLPLAQQELS